jgi:hypothetical protein
VTACLKVREGAKAVLALLRVTAIASVFILPVQALGQENITWPEAMAVWYTCLHAQVDLLAAADVSPSDVTSTALGNCKDEEFVFRSAPFPPSAGADDIRDRLIARIVNIRLHGQPTPP